MRDLSVEELVEAVAAVVRDGLGCLYGEHVASLESQGLIGGAGARAEAALVELARRARGEGE